MFQLNYIANCRKAQQSKGRKIKIKISSKMLQVIKKSNLIKIKLLYTENKYRYRNRFRVSKKS